MSRLIELMRFCFIVCLYILGSGPALKYLENNYTLDGTCTLPLRMSFKVKCSGSGVFAWHFPLSNNANFLIWLELD